MFFSPFSSSFVLQFQNRSLKEKTQIQILIYVSPLLLLTPFLNNILVITSMPNQYDTHISSISIGCSPIKVIFHGAYNVAITRQNQPTTFFVSSSIFFYLHYYYGLYLHIATYPHLYTH